MLRLKYLSITLRYIGEGGLLCPFLYSFHGCRLWPPWSILRGTTASISIIWIFSLSSCVGRYFLLRSFTVTCFTSTSNKSYSATLAVSASFFPICVPIYDEASDFLQIWILPSYIVFLSLYGENVTVIPAVREVSLTRVILRREKRQECCINIFRSVL